MKASQCKGYVTLGDNIYAIDHHNAIRGQIIPIPTKCANSDEMCFRSELRECSDNVEGAKR